MTGDLKVVKVYVNDGKQTCFDVMKADGSILSRVAKSQMLDAIRNGHKFVNATVSDSGVVRVANDVPREQLQEVRSITQASTITEKRAAFEAVKQYAKSLGIIFPDYFRVTGSCEICAENFILTERDLRALIRNNPTASDDEIREAFLNSHGIELHYDSSGELCI